MTSLQTLKTDTLWPTPQVKDNWLKECQEAEYKAPWIEIGSDEYWWFLECVPPIHQDQRGYVNSEPHTDNGEGEAIYLGVIETQGKYYAKLVTLKEFRKLKVSTAVLQNRVLAVMA